MFRIDKSHITLLAGRGGGGGQNIEWNAEADPDRQTAFLFDII